MGHSNKEEIVRPAVLQELMLIQKLTYVQELVQAEPMEILILILVFQYVQ